MNTDSYRHQIERIIGPVSRETWDELKAFERLFLRWSNAINLSAQTTLQELWIRHINDSAQLLPLAKGATKWADLGSGGGFPGIIIAMLIKPATGAAVDLIESNRKKAAFLLAAVTELKLPAHVNADRIEKAVRGLKPPEIVTARALAPLVKLLELTELWLSGSSVALFHKGRDYRREVDESAQHWMFDLVEHRSAIASDSVILEISNLRRRS